MDRRGALCAPRDDNRTYQPKISRQSKRRIARLITSENGSSAGQSGGAGADGGPVGFRNGGADVLDALRAEDGTEAAGGG